MAPTLSEILDFETGEEESTPPLNNPTFLTITVYANGNTTPSVDLDFA